MEEHYIIGAILVNILCVICYMLCQIFRKKEQRNFVLGIFFLFTPVLGFIFYICSIGIYKIFFRKNILIDEGELSFRKKRSRVLINDDMEKEANLVPMEEALRISDTLDKRQMFIELLKREDIEDHVGVIRSAMDDTDTEIVHYAATYITDMISKSREDEYRLRMLCEKEEGDDKKKLLEAYITYCLKVLQMHIYSDPDQKIYLQYLDEKIVYFFQNYQSLTYGNWIVGIYNLWKEQDKEERMEFWIQVAERTMEQEVESAKLVLKYYFEKGMKESFQNTILKIKNSPLILDNECLDWIRFYQD